MGCSRYVVAFATISVVLRADPATADPPAAVEEQRTPAAPESTPPSSSNPSAVVEAARVPLLSDAEAWERLPQAEEGAGGPLPAWARALAGNLPRTTAAMLELDWRHRAVSPLDPILRGKLRWTVAQANRCQYGTRYAVADLVRLG
ncbi:MAG TPA: hypothetical protein VGX76_13665, partial [Pirellulales bacterium]|nr:hypothetical protein [Pirellulales bacterium]